MSKSVLYSNAIVKTFENKLLNPDRVRRMLDADNLTDAVRVLYECGYNESMITQSPDDIDAILSDELVKTVMFFKKMCADANLVKVVMRRYDYHNLKVYLKEKYGAADPADSVYPFGEMGPDKIRQVVKEETYNDFPPVMGDAVRLLKKIFAAGEPSGKLIDVTIDVAMYNETSQYAKKIKNGHIRQYYSCEADLRNVCTAARMKMHGFSKEAMAVQLVAGGNLDSDKLYRMFDGTPDTAPYIFITTGYYNLIKELSQIMSEKKPLSDFETKADDFLFSLSRIDKDNYFDSNPLFCWFIEKIAEIKAVKLILVCKKNGLRNDAIREKLKTIYV